MSTNDGGQEQLILDMVDRFLEQEVKPHVWKLEHDDIYPTEIVEKMKAMGLFGCLIAPEYGGLGLSTVTYAKIIERISIVWMSVAGIVNSHVIMSMAVQRNGTEAQKKAYLPRFATGELRGGIGLTEGAFSLLYQNAGRTCRRFAQLPGVTATIMSSMARRCGLPTAFMETALRCLSRPIPMRNRVTKE